MRIRPNLAAALGLSAIAALCPFVSVASVAPSAVTRSASPELPQPPVVRSVNGVAHLKLTAAIDPATRLPAFFYAGATVPPTIRVWPGDTLVIDYTNNLPAQTSMPLDLTNLHTHGLMDSPKAPGDQVIMTMIAPGQTYRYVYGIPKNQPPGLYWYHPHPHGESNHQVASGMSGLIIIEGIETYAPAVRGLPERDILLRDYYYDASLAPLARARRKTAMHAARARTLAAWAPDCNPADASDGVSINGVEQAVITMAPGSRQFFRIANTSANSYFDMKIPGERLYVVAYDGVPLAFHNRAVTGRWVDDVVIPPAGRAEVVVAAPAKTGTPFETGCIDTGPDGDNDPGRTLALINLGRPPAVPAMSFAGAPPVAEPFGPLANRRFAAARVVSFSEDNPDSEFYINGRLWDPNAPPMFVVKAGTVEQWTLYNYATEVHVFHIHQIHFMVQDVNGVQQPPESWRDTVSVPYAKPGPSGRLVPGVVHVVMDFRDPIIIGTFVFHCHILEHEDYGMMAKIQVVGPTVPALNLRGYREGYLTRPQSRFCKLQPPGVHLCGCDKSVVSMLPQQR